MLVCYERMGLCKCFCAFNTVLYRKKLLQLVLWNKYEPLKQQGYNGFPQINLLFKIFSNQPQTVYYNGWLQKVMRNKYSFLETNGCRQRDL